MPEQWLASISRRRPSGRRSAPPTSATISSTILAKRSRRVSSCSIDTPLGSGSRRLAGYGFTKLISPGRSGPPEGGYDTRSPSTMVDRIVERVRAGQRIDRAEAVELYRCAPTPLLGRLADDI